MPDRPFTFLVRHPTMNGEVMTTYHEEETSQRSIEHQPSETAMATATLRAMAAHDEREEIRGPDYLAELFLTEDRKAPLKDPAVRQWVMKNRIAPGAYEFMIARTAFFDRVVRDSLLQNIPQIVLLGAGYDSRPYRFKDLARETRIFELDARPTQDRKKEVLEQAGIPFPAHLLLVPIDFNKDDLKDTLLSAGFSKDQRALFIWEGVTYYLPAQVVKSTLDAIRGMSCVGSSICFDYASLSAEALGEEGAKTIREHMKSKFSAEPTQFGIPQGKIEAFLAEHGYVVVELLTHSEMESRYLTLRDGSTVGRVPALFSLVRAASAAKMP
jgi:methyltransferase (TIGR00027 family)